MKKRTVFTILFVVLAACAIGAGFFALKQKQEREAATLTTQPESRYHLADEAYNNSAQKLDTKVYESDIDGLFYSLSPVRYFYAKNGKIAEIPASGSLRAIPSVAGTDMVFDIDYVTVSGQAFGVAQWQAEEGVYTDAFAVLKDMPAAFGSSGDFLLMIDTEKSDKAAPERLYSELFSCDADGAVGGYVFEQRNRTVGSNGKLRTDWDVMTLSALSNPQAVYSLTGRTYNREEPQRYDLRRTRSGNTQTVANDVSDLLLFSDESGVQYIRTDESGWEIVRLENGEEAVVASFEGDFYQEYHRDSGFAVRDNGAVITDLQTGREHAPSEAFKQLYAAKQNGERFVWTGKEENRDGKSFKVQKILLMQNNTSAVLFANDIMDENSALSLCREGLLTEKDGKSVFISYTNLEKICADMVK